MIPVIHLLLARLENAAARLALHLDIWASNRALARFELALALDTACRGTGCSPEWKKNHLLLTVQGMDMSKIGYRDAQGVREDLDEETWVDRLLWLTERIHNEG